jgi:hypothetical protein
VGVGQVSVWGVDHIVLEASEKTAYLIPPDDGHVGA